MAREKPRQTSGEILDKKNRSEKRNLTNDLNQKHLYR